jgi:putative transposase
LLSDLKNRGLNEPALAIADGGLGFWAALPEVFGQTKEQLPAAQNAEYFEQITEK